MQTAWRSALLVKRWKKSRNILVDKPISRTGSILWFWKRNRINQSTLIVFVDFNGFELQIAWIIPRVGADKWIDIIRFYRLQHFEAQIAWKSALLVRGGRKVKCLTEQVDFSNCTRKAVSEIAGNKRLFRAEITNICSSAAKDFPTFSVLCYFLAKFTRNYRNFPWVTVSAMSSFSPFPSCPARW